MSRWQHYYDNNNQAKHYKTIEPLVSKQIKYMASHRGLERTITRLRIGHCLLNTRLHKYNRMTSGNCTQCSVPEDVNHYLTCPHKNLLDGIGETDPIKILSDPTLSTRLGKNIAKTKRAI